jgi:hypothetical protein
MNNKVNFFIVGQPKCGTTSLFHYFKKHKEVFMPEQKQLYFFAKDHNEYRKKHEKFNTDHYSKYYNYKFEDYISRFDFQENINVYGDITPDYIYSKTAPLDIYEYNKNAKILVILREPLSFLKSFHSQLIQSGREHEADFYKALSYQETRLKDVFKNDEQSPPFYFQYDELVNYLKLVKSYHDKFKDNFKIIFYDDFRRDNKSTLDNICDFLDIKKFDHIKNIESNVSMQGINKLDSIKKNKLIKLFISLVPTKLKYWIKDNIFRLIFKKKEEDLNDNLDIKLKEKFYQNIQELNQYITEHNLNLDGGDINLLEKWNYD